MIFLETRYVIILGFFDYFDYTGLATRMLFWNVEDKRNILITKKGEVRKLGIEKELENGRWA